MNLLNKVVVSTLPLFPKSLVRVFANKYIAGDNLAQAVNTVKDLNAKKFMATMDVLGESISSKEEAVKSKDEQLEVLDAIKKNNLDSNLSIKLTMLGMKSDLALCESLFTEVLDKAKELNIFVRIDMEESAVTETTIQLFEKMRKRYDNLGIVLQAYLRRTEKDVIRLSEQKVNFRICKGIYIEPEEIAFKGYQEVRDNYLKVLRLAFERGAYCGVATHDDFLITGAEKIVKDLGLSREQYEFQMLLGVRERLRNEVLMKGHRMRIYVPFGQRWYEYSIRRFQENPNVAGQVLKSIFTGQ
ncbi:MAG: proline dehydrogenase family protein [Bacteroidetes bacterium]|nr:proline dehydrogenase family protein [Bacteroidota bacterium]